MKNVQKKIKGTEIRFCPDPEIFDTIKFIPKKLYEFIKMKSVLVGGTSISFKIDNVLITDKTPNKELFYYKNGIHDYLNEKTSNEDKLFEKIFSLKKNFKENEKFEIFISFNKYEKSSFKSFCNTIDSLLLDFFQKMTIHPL